MNSIKQHLDTHRRSQHDFAQAVNITDSHLSRILSGHRAPSLRVLKRMAKELRVSIGKLAAEVQEYKREGPPP